MTRFRILLSLVIVLACGVGIVALLAAKRSDHKWDATLLPPPDTLTEIRHLTISSLTREWSFDVTDPSEIASFTQFVGRGTYEHMLKTGYRSCIIRVDHGHGEAEYYHHGDALGPMPGGAIQIVFVPTEPGFQDWLEELLRQHGRGK